MSETCCLFLLDIPSSPQNVWINNVEFEPRIHWKAPKHPGGLPLSYSVRGQCKNVTRSDNPYCKRTFLLCYNHLIVGTDINTFMCTLTAVPLQVVIVSYEAFVEVKNALGINRSSPVEFRANKYEIFLSEYTYNLLLLNIISNIYLYARAMLFCSITGKRLAPLPHTHVIIHSKYFFVSDWLKSWPACVDIK